MGPALIVFGGIIFLIGAIIAIVGIKNMKRRSRIIQTPTSPIVNAPGGGAVEIKGRIVPTEQGVLQAPFSGRYGVWVRIVVQERRSSGRNSYWATVVNETDFRHFMVDDGSGQMARVIPTAANVVLEKQNVASSGTFNDPPPHLHGFLASRGVSTSTFLGFNKSMRYEEELLAPGDPVFALGPSRREAGPPVHDGYRMTPSSQLVLFQFPGPEGELILTNKTEEQLISKLLWGFVGGAITAGIGFVMIAAGAVAALIE